MKKILLVLKHFCLLPIYFYKFLISPLLPHVCRFTPSCSNYFVQAVEEFGIAKGFVKGIKRVFRCRPGVQGGYDPVPINIKGDSKWLL